MPKKVINRRLKGAKYSLRLRKLNRAAHKAVKLAAAAKTPAGALVDPQDNSSQDHSSPESEVSCVQSLDLDARERFKRLIRVALDESDDKTMGRRLLVTGGATVPFVALLKEATGEDFLQELCNHGFTHVYLQCGVAHEQIKARLEDNDRGDGLQIETFDFCRDLKSLMREHCRGEKDVQPAGVVMGHAGKFTFTRVSQTSIA